MRAVWELGWVWAVHCRGSFMISSPKRCIKLSQTLFASFPCSPSFSCLSCSFLHTAFSLPSLLFYNPTVLNDPPTPQPHTLSSFSPLWICSTFALISIWFWVCLHTGIIYFLLLSRLLFLNVWWLFFVCRVYKLNLAFKTIIVIIRYTAMNTHAHNHVDTCAWKSPHVHTQAHTAGEGEKQITNITSFFFLKK